MGLVVYSRVCCTHTHTRTHACAHARTHAHTHTHTDTHTHTHTRTYTHTHTHTHTHRVHSASVSSSICRILGIKQNGGKQQGPVIPAKVKLFPWLNSKAKRIKQFCYVLLLLHKYKLIFMYKIHIIAHASYVYIHDAL